MSARIDIPKDEIVAFCQRNHIRRLALFGSVLRDDFTPESDVDVLVGFEPGQTLGLEFITMQDELSDILGRQVDMYTFKGVELWKIIRNDLPPLIEQLKAIVGEER